MGDNSEMADLVWRVRQGDPDAYEILVNRYRLAALSWARAIVRDAYLAEDVVQEAFIRMKEKIHDLQDDRKFAAWFRLMVRRLSINSIRGASRSSEFVTEEITETEWLGQAGTDKSEADAWEEREDGEDLIRSSLYPLSRQAREVLSASAYDEATPEELAVRFGINKSNVYNILSRARVKANDERFRNEIERYLQDRRRGGQTVARLLKPPVYSHPYAFISVLVGEALRSAGEQNCSYTDLMGISGEAFRLNVATGCQWQGISTFDWSYTAYRTFERLGIGGTCFGRPQRSAITPEQQVHILSVIHESVERGIPAIIRNMQMNEFGFVYGYDDEAQEIRYLGYNRAERTYRYDQLGRTGENQPTFILGIRERVASPQSTDESLRSIVDHARGKEPPLEGFAFGLDGYRLWLEAVDNGTLDLHGHAYQVAILAEARHQAANYLHELSDKSSGADHKRQLIAAAECYGKVGESFTRLYPSFPFGYGGSHANRFAKIREGLQAAWNAEAEGISIIESINKRP
ncbi:RNA polymerase sigma factor [Cohnella silvisoli]|uniref:RNA polymerase sigma factor n=1 Tax=Cohnella silvisoli TaxID=2873699 RepID=A0ABV1KSX3_9BACL|nr:RNA polymerase sigma factor [Cohnella silvisoli]MCD9022579.1 RNA polymerase sigma factor [Cohnella silvisoli]